jgi:hypothetical protein
LVCTRLSPTTGWLMFVVTGYVCGLLVYGVVTFVGGSLVEVKDRLAAALIATAAFVVMFCLALIVGYTFWQGRTALGHLNFFTQDLSRAGPLDPLSKGGVLHAIAGTLFMISLSVVLTVPLGIGCGVFLTEVGGRGSRLVRTVVQSMTALPSIVAGLLIGDGDHFFGVAEVGVGGVVGDQCDDVADHRAGVGGGVAGGAERVAGGQFGVGVVAVADGVAGGVADGPAGVDDGGDLGDCPGVGGDVAGVVDGRVYDVYESEPDAGADGVVAVVDVLVVAEPGEGRHRAGVRGGVGAAGDCVGSFRDSAGRGGPQ